jgi:hypothetical protein
MLVRPFIVAVIVGVLVVFGLGSTAPAAEFTCTGGNVACLVAAIRAANALTEPSTIRLAAGVYTLTAVDNTTDGPNGLPSVTRTLSIQGSDAQATIIERAPDAPDFRLVHVAPTGALALEGLTLRGGSSGSNAADTFPGGGILNRGRVTLGHSRLVGNRAGGPGNAAGGGLFNIGGTVTLSSSTLADNVVGGQNIDGFGGGLATAGGVVTITNSAVVDNLASAGGATGGGLAELAFPFSSQPAASVEIVNSTIARNRAFGRVGRGGGLATGQGRWTITSSTIAGNAASGFGASGGGIAASGPVSLQNTLIAQNAVGGNFLSGPDCAGPVTSLDHNLIGNPTDCAIALQPNDRIGGPGLAIYTDDGTPGNADWPLLPTSQAIGGGDASTCPPTDQLGRPRLGRCDIGAVQFVAVIDPLGDFVRGFYRHALGREPHSTEVAGWVSFLQASPTPARARVLTHAFFDGGEYRARPFTPQSHVTALYRAILGRDPEPPAGGAWIGLLNNRGFEIRRVFVASPEFQALVPSCHDESAVRALVTRLYEKLLGRSPGTGELESWVFNVMMGCSLDNPVGTVLVSEEYTRVPRTLAAHVTNLYRALLAREPRPDEVAGWVDYLAPPFIEDQFIDSPEFAARWLDLVN